MRRTVLVAMLQALLAGAVPVAARAQAAVKSAMSAAPTSISANATIMDWNFKVLQKGTNEWTCLPDRPDTPGTDPWCVTGAWLNFLNALVKKAAPTYKEIGIAYMLQGDTPVSNSDPFATKPTGPEDWVTHLGAHLMVLIPDRALLKSFPTNHLSGGPWVMWPGTPYAHLMIPLEARGPAPS